jgi:hypothetical protein
MIRQSLIRSGIKMNFLVLIGLGLILFSTHLSFADPAKCMGKCQANRMCTDLVAQKNLKDADRKAEHNKCHHRRRAEGSALRRLISRRQRLAPTDVEKALRDAGFQIEGPETMPPKITMLTRASKPFLGDKYAYFICSKRCAALETSACPGEGSMLSSFTTPSSTSIA